MSDKTITIFKNIKDTQQPFYRDCMVVLNRIKIGSSKVLVNKIRLCEDKDNINKLKQELPAICFSGKFNKRNDKSIVSYSGLICLDFDNYSSVEDMLSFKDHLKKDKYTYSVFISPSGNGLKLLVKLPQDKDNHLNYFLSLEEYYSSDNFDKTSKNISRVCYESYDPDIYINDNSEVWVELKDKEYNDIVKLDNSLVIPISDENKIVDILLKWWVKKYPMVEGERNQNVYILASSLNDFGINKTLATYILSRYESNDFKNDEILKTIDSAYNNKQNFGTKCYEDEDKLKYITSIIRKGASKKEAIGQLLTMSVDDSIAEKIVSKIEEDISSQKFWSKSEKGSIKIIHIMFKKFLEDNGFYKFVPEGSKNYIFIKITNNIIDHASENDIKDFVLSHLINLDDDDIYNHFADKTRYFREDFLTLLGTIDVYFINDDRDSSYLYYKNSVVKTTKDSVDLIDYIDLGGYVWKDHLIDRNFNVSDISDCDFKKFISNICGADQERINSMESTIGFLLHGHKGQGYCPSVILNDEVISDNPEGGTGKGLIMNALSKLKKVVVIDGKAFNFEKSFPYQTVSADTQIIVFDDVKKHFDFERLFSVVTEGITLEKKNKDAIKIQFERSPKIAITTNYAIKGTGNSFARRKWELELHQYYNNNFTPLDEFGKVMFADWCEEQWCQFDNYMIECLKNFINNGLVKAQFVNQRIRALSANTCHEFIDWCGLIGGDISENLSRLINGGSTLKQELYNEFIDDNPDFAPKSKMSISRIKFYKWVNFFCQYKGEAAPEEWRDANGKWIRMKTKHDLERNEEFLF